MESAFATWEVPGMDGQGPMGNSATLKTAFAVSILLAAGAVSFAAWYSSAGPPADCGASCLSSRFDNRVDRAYGEPGSGASGADGESSSCVGQCSGSSGAGSAGTDGESSPGGSVKGAPGSPGAPGTSGSDGAPGTSGADGAPGSSEGPSQPEAAGAQEVAPRDDAQEAPAPHTPPPSGQESAPESDAGCTGLGSLLNLLGLGSLLNLC